MVYDIDKRGPVFCRVYGKMEDFSLVRAGMVGAVHLKDSTRFSRRLCFAKIRPNKTLSVIGNRQVVVPKKKRVGGRWSHNTGNYASVGRCPELLRVQGWWSGRFWLT